MRPHRHTQIVKAVAAVAIVALAASGLTSAAARSVAPAPKDPATQAVSGLTGACTSNGTAAAAPASLALPEYQQIVIPGGAQSTTVEFGGARLVIRPNAVKLPVGIGITRLRGNRSRVPVSEAN